MGLAWRRLLRLVRRRLLRRIKRLVRRLLQRVRGLPGLGQAAMRHLLPACWQGLRV